MRRERISRFGLALILASTAACSAIAGLDGDFELQSGAGASSGAPDGSNDVNTSSSGTSSSGQTDARVEDAPADTDTGPIDSGTKDAPVDSPIDTGPTIDVDTVPPSSFTPMTGTGDTCPASFPATTFFCWNFKANDGPSPFNWTTAETDQGTVDVQGPVNSYERMFFATITTPTPAVDGGAGLWLNIIHHDNAYDVGDTVTYTVSFRVASGATLAGSVAVIESRGRRYGLVVHPASWCENKARPCLTDNTASPSKQTAFDLDAWYRTKIMVTRRSTGASDTWDGKILVGSKTIATASDVWNPGNPEVIRLGIGALDPQAPGGTGLVNIDDILLEDTP